MSPQNKFAYDKRLSPHGSVLLYNEKIDGSYSLDLPHAVRPCRHHKPSTVCLLSFSAAYHEPRWLPCDATYCERARRVPRKHARHLSLLMSGGTHLCAHKRHTILAARPRCLLGIPFLLVENVTLETHLPSQDSLPWRARAMVLCRRDRRGRLSREEQHN